MNPLVSILIPVYNREELVLDSINSAINQTYQNLEIIIVDNCSIDGTWDLIKQISKYDNRIKAYRNNSNIGPVKNWLKCVSLAKGNYSKILFSDDIMESNCIEKFISVFKDSDSAFVFSSVKIIRDDFQVFSYNNFRKPIIYKFEFLISLIIGKAPVSPCAGFFRTNDLKNSLKYEIPSKITHDYNKTGAGPDFMIYLNLLNIYGKCIFLDENLVSFRAHQESISCNDSNGEVYQSYLSAFSYYISQSEYKFLLTPYLSYKWLSNLYNNKKLLRVSKFLENHQIKPTFKNCLFFYFNLPICLIYKLLFKIYF